MIPELSYMPPDRDPDDPGRGPPLTGSEVFDPRFLRDRVREQPDDWRTWFRLGYRLLEQCSHEPAADALKEAARLAPDNGLAHYLLGIALCREQRQYEARTSFVRATQLRPADPGPWRLLGELCWRAECWASAAEALSAAARLEPTGEIYWQLGVCLDQLNRDREAVVAFEEAVRLKRNHLPALLALYHLARRHDELDVARGHLETLFRYNPVRARELMEGYREPVHRRRFEVPSAEDA
ncbi:MAG: tetratricopeptide repeat protein [Longimicrobiales bacterium]